MKRWTQVFKILANISRLRIIKLLSDGSELSVSDVAVKIHVSYKGTSKHLILLENFAVLKSEGKAGRVFYKINDSMPVDIRSAISLFMRERSS